MAYCGSTVRKSVQTRRMQERNKQQYDISMGLFGLGWPEIAVIVVVGTLIFGPKKISELGKDLGKVVGSMKQATSEFAEGMEESLKDSEEKRKKNKESDEETKEERQSLSPSSSDGVYDVSWQQVKSEKEHSPRS
eukprot:jgi/Galph1/3104/GphlegSOOS_G1811.1